MTKPLSDLEKSKALESLKMLYGDAPYNKWSNFVSGDAYFAASLEKKYGMTIRELGVLCGYASNRNLNPEVVGEVADVLNGHSNAAVYYNRENDTVEIIHPSIDNLSIKKTIIIEKPVDEEEKEIKPTEVSREPVGPTETESPKEKEQKPEAETAPTPTFEPKVEPKIEIKPEVTLAPVVQPAAPIVQPVTPIVQPSHTGSENVRLFREELNIVKAFKDAHDAIQIAEEQLKSYFGPLVREVTTEEEGKAILERIPECVSKSFFEEYLAFKKTSFQ